MQKLRELIKGEIGKNIISLGTVGSTNTYAVELAGKGAVHGTVVIAESQTGGRGRMGRTWISPPGNIYMSAILLPHMQASDATLLTLMAGVACCRALRNITGLFIDIKWPNDLMVSTRKIGGVLTEIKSGGGKVIFAVIGIGINVNAGPEEFPPDLKTIATSVRNETAKKQPANLLAAAILNELDYWYRILTERGKEKVPDEWRKLTSTLGKSVRVASGDEILTGIADDIDDKGMLMLKLPSGAIRRVSAGDLTVL